MTHEPFDAIPDDDTLVERFEPTLVAVAAELGSLALFCHERGWAPAAGASFSARAGSARALLTAAGREKGTLTTADFVLVDFDGKFERPGPAPSEDAPLHCALYRKWPDVGAVAHAHSVAATVLSRHFARRGGVTLRGYAMARALGAAAPEAALVLPVFKNSFDDEALARAVESKLDAGAVGFLIEGRGLTTWGADPAALRSRLEAIEFLLACELAALSLPADGLASRGPPRPASTLGRSPGAPWCGRMLRFFRCGHPEVRSQSLACGRTKARLATALVRPPARYGPRAASFRRGRRRGAFARAVVGVSVD